MMMTGSVGHVSSVSDRIVNLPLTFRDPGCHTEGEGEGRGGGAGLSQQRLTGPDPACDLSQMSSSLHLSEPENFALNVAIFHHQPNSAVSKVHVRARVPPPTRPELCIVLVK